MAGQRNARAHHPTVRVEAGAEGPYKPILRWGEFARSTAALARRRADLWAVWHDERVWFSCGPHSRKARNLGAEPRCTVTTDDAANPVVVEGVAERIADPGAIEAVRVAMVTKYDYEVSLDFLLANAVFAVRPAKVIGLVEDDFTGSPTRWRPPFG